jgi:hypothetical protein
MNIAAIWSTHYVFRSVLPISKHERENGRTGPLSAASIARLLPNRDRLNIIPVCRDFTDVATTMSSMKGSAAISLLCWLSR